MKRIIIGVIACICAITAMAQAQTHDVKGVVFDRRQQPIVGALVTAQGTNISTITDVDGKFLLQEVPLSVKKVIVTSIGMETREGYETGGQPVLVESAQLYFGRLAGLFLYP